MSFIVKNTEFICFFCGEKNPPALRTCRNHCRKCLSSVHLDDIFPGDRESQCLGKMELYNIFTHNKYDFVFEHKCVKCGKVIKNKCAEDDSREKVFEFLREKSHNEFLGR